MHRICRLVVVVAAVSVASATSAQQQSASVAAANGARAAARTQAFSTTIQGNALSSTNGQLASTTVRLRDARYGRVVATQVTDGSGMFAFRSVEPGSYVVEIMSSDQRAVLAASEILNVNAGDVMSAVVKLPFRLPPFAGILSGNAATPASAAAVMTQAAANSVLIAATPPGAVDSCPVQK